MLKKIFVLLFIVLFFCVGCTENTDTGDTLDYQFKTPNKKDATAVIKTSMGDIKIMFFPKEAPKAVENFITHSKNDYYNDLVFHRVMKEFMIQGGDPLGNGTGGESIWGNPFEDEFSDKLHNFRGAVCMANSGENTNGSQFFIVQKKTVDEDLEQWMIKMELDENLMAKYIEVGGTPWLDNKHTVFGQVIEGMDVVDNIANVEIGADHKPLDPVIIESIQIID